MRNVRYDVFLATLLQENNKKLSLPENINLISWNYDLQFELAYNEFDGSDELTAFENLNIVPFQERSITKGNIVKMNGMAGVFSTDSFNSFSGFDLNKYLKNPIEAMNKLIKLYITQPVNNFLNFAWEMDGNEISKKAYDGALEIMSRTDYLVIIGYSFPNFNKKIDRELLFEAKSLEKVYFQAPESEIKGLCKGFQWLTSAHKSPEEITDLRQFFIPPEFVFPIPKPLPPISFVPKQESKNRY